MTTEDAFSGKYENNQVGAVNNVREPHRGWIQPSLISQQSPPICTIYMDFEGFPSVRYNSESMESIAQIAYFLKRLQCLS